MHSLDHVCVILLQVWVLSKDIVEQLGQVTAHVVYLAVVFVHGLIAGGARQELDGLRSLVKGGRDTILRHHLCDDAFCLCDGDFEEATQLLERDVGVYL